jgi:hypothetical protein
MLPLRRPAAAVRALALPQRPRPALVLLKTPSRPVAPCRVASGSGSLGDAADKGKKPEPEALGSMDELVSYPPDFVKRRLLVFAGILISYTCL